MKIIIPKGSNLIKIYISICKILLKMIIQGLLLIFGFLEFWGDPCPRDKTRIQYQNENFVPKIKFSIPKRDKYTKLDKNIT